MTDRSVSLTLSPAIVDVGEILFLEQMSWEAYTGTLTKADVVAGVSAFILPDVTSLTTSRCGGYDRKFDTVVYAYLYDQSLNYLLERSAGELGPRVIEEVEYQQSLVCSLEDFVEFDYPSIRVVALPEWRGQTYDVKGDECEPPSYEITNRGIKFAYKVYGSLTVRYLVRRHKYEFNLTKNEDVIEGTYFAVVYARWTGGITHLQIEPPDNFEASDGDCQNGSVYFTSAPGKEKKYKVYPKIEEKHIEYCTQEERRRV